MMPISDLMLLLKYRVLYPAIASLPKKIAYKSATLIGLINYRFDSDYRQAVMSGIRALLPELDDKSVDAHTRLHMGMLAREPLDVFRISRMRLNNIDSYLKLRGLENLEEALAGDRPVMLYSAHFGRMIMPSISIGFRGHHAACLIADLTSDSLPTIERRYLTDKMRKVQSVTRGEVVQRSENLRKLFHILDERCLLAVTVDTPRTKKDTFTEFPFFDGTARLPNGVVRIARKKKAIMVPYFAVETANGLEGHYLKGVDISEKSDDEAFQLLYAPVIDYIKNYPSQWWLWPVLGQLWRKDK